MPDRDTGLVPVSPERLGNHFWRRFSSYDFATDRPRLPLSIAETREIASLFPIAFVKTPEPDAVILMQIEADGQVPYVDPDSGAWLGHYVPAALRAYPFEIGVTDDGQRKLFVDPASGLITGVPTDEPFFTPDGRLSPATQKVAAFLQQRLASEAATKKAVMALDEAQLLIPFAQQGHLDPDLCTGLWMVDQQRLANLVDDQIVTLHRIGALMLAHAQLISAQHCSRRLRMAKNRDMGSGDSARTEPAPALSGFLDALSAAQEADANFGNGAEE